MLYKGATVANIWDTSEGGYSVRIWRPVEG